MLSYSHIQLNIQLRMRTSLQGARDNTCMWCVYVRGSYGSTSAYATATPRPTASEAVRDLSSEIEAPSLQSQNLWGLPDSND